jgi:hypothetical protein
MTINHNGHDHPATPAGRAACRKAMAGGATPAPATGKMKITVAPKGGRKPVKVKGVQGPDGDMAAESWRVRGTGIPEGSKLLGVPAYIAEAIQHAWAQDWYVRVGQQWDSKRKTVVIVKDDRNDDAPTRELGVAWIGTGIHGVMFRPAEGEEAVLVPSLNEGLRLMAE